MTEAIAVQEAEKFSPVEIEITQNPVFIVGQCPGKQTKKRKTLKVWEGNRSGDLMQKIIKDFKNLYLTNAFNYYVKGKVTPEIIDTGESELVDAITTHKPKVIICFGDFAYKKVIDLTPIKAIKLVHPGYILRFNMDQSNYLKNCRKTISEALK